MSKQFLGLRTTIYKVNDLAKAKEWYAKAFDTLPYFDEDFYVGYEIGGYELGLLPNGEASLPRSESVVAYWGVEDIQESFSRLMKLGATANEQPENVGGNVWAASVKDPWENIIGIIYNPYFKLK